MDPFERLPASRELRNVWCGGFVYHDATVHEFHPSSSAYFLEFEGLLLRVSCSPYDAHLTLDEVDRVDVDLDLDDDMTPAIMSTYEALMADPTSSNRLRRVHLWNVRRSTSSLACDALRIDLENGQILFFDPLYFHGMRIGGPEQEALWLENARRAEHEVTVVDLG